MPLKPFRNLKVFYRTSSNEYYKNPIELLWECSKYSVRHKEIFYSPDNNSLKLTCKNADAFPQAAYLGR